MKYPMPLQNRIHGKRVLAIACIFFSAYPPTALAAAINQSSPTVAVDAAVPVLEVAAAGPKSGSASQPKRISIPSISVNAEIVPVGLNPKTKSLVVPKQGSIVGWFSRGAEQRPTVLVGHVDTAKKAAVFYRLPKLRNGDSIKVTNSDSTTRRYRVDRITRVDKDKFPTKSVYLGSGLRLITCGGKFDRKTGHYEENVIVFATAF
jgi:LPXTG-site transpeptidase (sortase) family protein